MWKTLFLSLFLILSMIPASNADDEYPACWERDLRLIEVSARFYESELSWLERVETKEALLEFASAYLPYRQRDWISKDRCAESIEFAWGAQREISLRAAYKAVDFGLRERLDYDPDVLAEYNPVGGALADSFYPERFNQELERIRALAASEERQYILSPQDGALPNCNDAELARLAPILPEYQRMLEDSKTINSKMELVELANWQIRWRATWASENIDRSEDGRISFTPRDGLAQLPACEEAAEFLWLMNRSVNDLTSGIALIYAGFGEDDHPTFRIFNRNADIVDDMIARIEAIEPEQNEAAREWTTCTEAQRDALNKMLPVYEEFVGREKPELTKEAVSRYFRDEVSWRQELWSSLPHCADAVELALSFSQFASDQRALVAFEMAGLPNSLNPFRDEVAMGEHIVESFGAGLVGGSLYREFPPRLPNCSLEETGSLATMLAQYQMFREHMTNFGTMAGFFAVVEPLVIWRDKILGALPACREAFEAGLLMSQMADDYIALFGLTFAGYSHKVNPYYEEFQAKTQELVDFMETLPIERGAHAVVWEFGGELNLCGIDEATLLSEILSEYLDLLDAGGRISSLEELRAFGDAQVAWRRESWPRLPSCAEAFEIGLHIYRNAGDQILFDVPAIAESQIANIIGGESPLKTRLGQIYSDLPRKWRSQHSGEIESHRRHCSASQRGIIIEALAGFGAVLDSAVDFEEWNLSFEPFAFGGYVDKRIAWRSEFAVGLPRCLIVFELDSVLALDVAESVTANIPVLGAILSGSDLLQAIASALAEGDHTVKAVPDYANRMPLCAEAELRGLKENYRAYSGLIEDVPDLESRTALFDYIEAKLDWREEIWASLPLCAEALELGFLIHQVASDIATAAALEWHDLGAMENPYIAQESLSRDALRGAVRKINRLIESGARRDTAPSSDSPLPRCNEGELDDITGYTYDHDLFVGIEERALPILFEYIKSVLNWRAETWAPLPACIESYILGNLVTRQKADFANFMALDFAGVSFEENPFVPEIGADARQLVELTELLRKFNLEGIDRFVEEYRDHNSL